MLQSVDPFTWRRVVRRCLLGSSTKLVAAVLADYASPDGTRIHPGTDRLTRVTELSDRSVRTALAKLREAGLVERLVEGSKNGRRGLADEYRLTIPDDLVERVQMLDPDEKPVDNHVSPATDAGDTEPAEQEHRQLVHRTPANGAGTPATIAAHLTKYSPNHPPTTLTSPKYGGAVESDLERARSPPGSTQRH